MFPYNIDFSLLGSTIGGCYLYVRNRNGGYSRFMVNNANHVSCDCGGTYQLTTLGHFGHLRHKYLKTYK